MRYIPSIHVAPLPARLFVLGLVAFVALAMVACGGDSAPKSSGKPVENSKIVLITAEIDAPLSRGVVPASGVMPSPVGDEVLLYDWTQHPGFGGLPGVGNTIVSGSRATVFKSLDKAKTGDLFTLIWEGKDYGYTVTSVCFWDSRDGGFEKVVETTTDETLTMLTSYGPADNVELGRLVVTARPRTLVIASACPAGLKPLSAIDFEPARP